MRSLRFHQFGRPAEQLRVEEVPTPSRGEGEVLIRVTAASVNPSDVKNVQGFMHQTTLPRTPGRDFAGTVVEGPGEWVGAEVWGTGGDLGFTRDGTHAEYLVLPASAVVTRPQALRPEAAAACGVTFVTAAYGLSEAGLVSGSTVVVIGVFGGVGRAAAQVARFHGASVIGVARTAPPADLPGSMSDVATIDSSREDPVAAVRARTGGRGADIVFDTVGGPMLLEALKYLAPRGRLIEISAGRDPNVTLNIRDFYHQQARLIGIDSLALDATASAAILRDLVGGFASGELAPPPVAATYPLAEAARAYAAVEAGGEGRHVLLPATGYSGSTSRGVRHPSWRSPSGMHLQVETPAPQPLHCRLLCSCPNSRRTTVPHRNTIRIAHDGKRRMESKTPSRSVSIEMSGTCQL
ncbi:MAG TPA: zinc-binding alcohol dehydrogenase family protein [Tepidisphaeraceae bacterium]